MAAESEWQFRRRFLTPPPGKNRPQPTPVGELLGGLLKEFAPTTRALGSGGERVRLETLQEQWSRVVGAELADLTRVVRYRQGVLTVKVEFAPLRAELEAFSRDRLLEDLNALGLRGVHDLRFC